MMNCANVSARQAQGYYEKDDYYTQKGQMPARWGGKIAEQLGLSGEFDQEKFVAALHGKFEGQTWAKTPSLQRAGFDIVFSAPKSVSMQGLVKGDKNIIAIHDAAVSRAMAHVESLARCRETNNKKTTSEPVDGIAYASFRHDTSRLGDPNLHTHNVILKAVIGSDGKLRALNNEEILNNQLVLDAIYKQELATGLREAGYVLIQTRDGFELDGYTKEALLEFSQRTQQIDAALDERGMSRETSSAAARSVVSSNTRDAKKTYDHDALRADWQARADGIGFALPDPPTPSKNGVASTEIEVLGQAQSAESMTPAGAIQTAIAHFSERTSVIKNKSQLIAFAMKSGEYKLTYKDVSQALDSAIGKGEILVGRNGRALVSVHSLDTEKRINAIYDSSLNKEKAIATLEQVERGIVQMEKAIAERRISKEESKLGRALSDMEKEELYDDSKLTKGQEKMVRNICTGLDGIFVVEGDAGTGKSTGMEAVKIICERNGFSVYGIAPSTQAVNALKDSGIDTVTSQGAIKNAKFWEKIDSKSVLILDEAGLIDARAMDKILALVRERGARICTVGDTKQFGSVEAGSAQDQLREKATKVGRLSRLDEMRRGENDFIRSVHFSSRDSTVNAIDMLHDKGDIQIIRNREKRIDAMAKTYAEMTEEEREKSFILTGKNIDRIAINEATRKELNLVGGVEVEGFEKKDDSKTEIKQLGSYEIGDVIKFIGKSSDFQRDDMLTVIEKKSDRLIVKKSDGSIIEFRPKKQARECIIGTVEKIQLAAGERIRFTANDIDKAYANGDKATILKIEGGHAVARLDKDKSEITIRLDGDKPLNVRHGYAQTGHSAQGGKGQTILLHTSHDDGTINKNSVYTNITRSTDRVIIYTDAAGGKELEKLRSAVARAAVKDSAINALEDPEEGRNEAKNERKPAYFAARKGFEKLDVPDQANKEAIEKILVEAAGRYSKDGNKLFIAGDDEFKKQVVDIAATKKIDVIFDDKKLEKARNERVQELARPRLQQSQCKPTRRIRDAPSNVGQNGAKRSQAARMEEKRRLLEGNSVEQAVDLHNEIRALQNEYTALFGSNSDADRLSQIKNNLQAVVNKLRNQARLIETADDPGQRDISINNQRAYEEINRNEQ